MRIRFCLPLSDIAWRRDGFDTWFADIARLAGLEQRIIGISGLEISEDNKCLAEFIK